MKTGKQLSLLIGSTLVANRGRQNDALVEIPANIEPGSKGGTFHDSDESVFGKDQPIFKSRELLKGELEFPGRVTESRIRSGGISGEPRDEFLFPSSDELVFGQSSRGLAHRMRLLESGIDPKPERVFDGDDRVRIQNTLDPNFVWARQVCSLIIETSSLRTVRGTGWMAGPRTIVTAGHNLYFHQEGGFAQNVRVIPGRNSRAAPFESFTVSSSRLVVTKGWSERQEVESDYGAIRIPDDYDTSRLGFFGMKAASDSELENTQANIAGYPVDVLPFGTLWWHGRRILAPTGPRTFRYNIDTSEGQSGSPVWIKEGDVRLVVGIHNYDFGVFNQATRISQSVLDTIREWRALG